jgi:hypothetical protein
MSEKRHPPRSADLAECALGAVPPYVLGNRVVLLGEQAEIVPQCE